MYAIMTALQSNTKLIAAICMLNQCIMLVMLAMY